jgi:hypothetical protein
MEASNIIKVSFANAEIPEFKEVVGQSWVSFGTDNKYPETLTTIYNKSSKHAAIVNGKVSYILGKGIKPEVESPQAISFIDKNLKVFKKAVKDVETYGGCYFQVIPNLLGTQYFIHHIQFEKVRSNKDGSVFYVKENWANWKNDDAKPFPAFKQGLRESSIYCYKEYRPGVNVYTLPIWWAAINFILSDIEVSKHTLTNAQSGFSGSKFINFFNGKPTPEGKREVTKQFRNEYGGSSGEKIVIGFNEQGDQPPTIDDLGASDLTKEDFTQVDNLITSNIFAAHGVTHPLLFGIQQSGKLGSGNELRAAYDIFKNTYVESKQSAFEEVINMFAAANGIDTCYHFIPTDPIGIEITEALMLANLNKNELREKMGYEPIDEIIGNQAVTKVINSLSPLVANKVLEAMSVDEIRGLAALKPATVGGDLIPAVATGGNNPTASTAPIAKDGMENEVVVNDNIKNLTAKQHQQLLRIIRQYTKGQITKEVATVLLKTGLGLNDTDVAAILGTNNTFSKALHFDAIIQDKTASQDAFNDDESVAMLFAAIGESKDNYKIFRSHPATFAAGEETAAIAKEISVLDKIRNVTKAFEVRYSYELRSEAKGPVLLETSRPFCKKLITADKFYKRSDIQAISALLGYDVFKRTGGFWNNNGTVEYHCRHEFQSHVILKKT